MGIRGNIWDRCTCGRVEYAQVDRQQTYLRGTPTGDLDRIQELRRSIQNQLAVTADAYEREKLQLTLASLAGQTVTISVGGTTEVAMFEQKQRQWVKIIPQHAVLGLQTGGFFCLRSQPG